MSLPATQAEMFAKGYARANYSRCSGCKAAIEWWRTPKGIRIPMDPMAMPSSPAVSHFATCTKVEQFRKGPQPCTASQTSTSPDSQPSLFSPSSSQLSDSSSSAPVDGKRAASNDNDDESSSN